MWQSRQETSETKAITYDDRSAIIARSALGDFKCALHQQKPTPETSRKRKSSIRSLKKRSRKLSQTGRGKREGDRSKVGLANGKRVKKGKREMGRWSPPVWERRAGFGQVLEE